MNKIVLIISVFITLISCKNKHENSVKNSSKANFIVAGQAFDKNQEIIFLKLVVDNQLIVKDSAKIKDNRFQLSGDISYPHKAVIQIKNHDTGFTFILNNDSTHIALNTAQMQSSVISNSKINTELKSIQQQSEAIFHKIDYLFPQLQKARMENDYKKLKEINIKINNIIIENQEFLYHYIQQNSNKYLSGLLLNDLWLSTEKDSIKLQDLARTLSVNVQKTLNFTIH